VGRRGAGDAETSSPLKPAAVWSLLEGVMVARPDDLALVSAGTRLSFAGLREAVDRACHVLAGAGVRRGTTVGVSAPNSADVVIAFLSVMRLGARWVGINTALGELERARLLDHCRARLVLTDLPTAASVLARAGPGRRGVISMAEEDGVSPWRSALGASPAARRATAVDPLLPAAIAYTSGTSGRPKGVLHSQHGISFPGRYLATTEDFDASAVVGVCLPLTILNVIVVAVLPALFAGRPCIVLPRLEAATIADWVHREGITNLSIPPPILYDLCTRDDIDVAALRTLRAPRTGGAELPDQIRRWFSERFGHGVVGTYGLTEAPSIVSIERRDVPHVLASSGQVVPYLRVRIVDGQGNAVPAGETGEICLAPRESGPWRGYRPMLGYWRRPAATRVALDGGLLHTGDVGRLDKDENLFVKDRKDNLILRGGANVYPAQVERVIRTVRGVADCVVVGLPDLRLGQRVTAVIEPDRGPMPTESEVLEQCRQHLARYEVPEVVVFIDQLPRNSMNKVLRSTVRDRIESLQGSG
jgi:long-chain acyl-CoA synthetase